MINVIKFRTMVKNADSLGPAWTSGNDPRITGIGRFLRRTALDELPQLLNVWKGDMCLVGPRALPEREQIFLEEEILHFKDRLRVRPGLTGLAQVYNISDDARDKLDYDLKYIERMSLWLDLKLIVTSILNTLLLRWDNRSGKVTQRSNATPGDSRKS